MMVYLFLAMGSIGLGIILSFVVVFVCRYLEVDIFSNLWILAIPLIVAVMVNICLIELYNKFKKK
jgi:hypothetical protein